VHLVKLEEGRLEIRPSDQASPRLASELGQSLSRIMGQRWIVTVSGAPGQATLAEQAGYAKAHEFSAVRALPIMQDILKVFPDAVLNDIIIDTDKKKDLPDV
jgi:DNA polymerase III subunit gamma/tau